MSGKIWGHRYVVCGTYFEMVQIDAVLLTCKNEQESPKRHYAGYILGLKEAKCKTAQKKRKLLNVPLDIVCESFLQNQDTILAAL